MPNLFRRVRTLRFVAASIALTLATGCVVVPKFPKASYKRVDTSTPEFKAAVEAEARALQQSGKSGEKAQQLAELNVQKRLASAEKTRREDIAAPLIAALQALEAPRGCWAYTMTTTPGVARRPSPSSNSTRSSPRRSFGRS